MPGFVHRQEELARLAGWWTAPNPRPGLVWGRRRVGKTALLQAFVHGKSAVFHTGAGRSRAGELTVFSRACAAVFPGGVRDLNARGFTDWDDALDSLAALAGSTPTLVVLDEFPEVALNAPELPGVLRAFLDRAGDRTGLRFLLCGSAVRSMRAVQEERAPLYGRFDLVIPLHPFRPHEVAALLPGMSAEDRAVVYGLVGGMPLYLSWWDPRATLTANLRRLVAVPGAPLLTEGQLVLSTEVDGGEYAGAVLDAIASGRTRYEQIRAWIGAEPARTLDRLVDLRLVERVSPVTDSARSRRRVYRVADPFLAFYLGLLARHRTEIERGLGPSVLPLLVAGLDDHMGPVWEEVFRDHLRYRAAGGEFGDVVALGSWWGERGQSEIDAVAVAGRSRIPVLVGEAKWSRSVNGRQICTELRAKARALTDDPAGLTCAVAARTRITNVEAGMLAITAADVFGAQ